MSAHLWQLALETWDDMCQGNQLCKFIENEVVNGTFVVACCCRLALLLGAGKRDPVRAFCDRMCYGKG